MKQKDIIILVADIRNWALESVANYVKSLLVHKYECHIIYSGDFKNYKDFIKSLEQYKSIKLIHFFYRGYFAQLLTEFATNISTCTSIDKLLKIAMTTSVPDHLWIENEADILKNLPLFQFADNYYTTSYRLYEWYKNISTYPDPWSVIYDNVLIDRSDFKLANKLKTSAEEELAISWIGNSRWGRGWHSEYDYKGFNTVIKPAFKQLKDEGIRIKQYILDKNNHLLLKQEVWAILKKTDILLIASIEEGTPLPLIEAMAFGCAIISTNVGIVNEVLPEIQHEFIINRSSAKFVEAIKKLHNQRELLSAIKQQNFTAYQKIFADNTTRQHLWLNFVHDSINKSATQDQVRIDFLHNSTRDGNWSKESRLESSLLLPYAVGGGSVSPTNSLPNANSARSLIKYQLLKTIAKANKSAREKMLQKILRISFIKKPIKYFLKYWWFKEGVKFLVSRYHYFFSGNEYNNLKNFILKYQQSSVNQNEENIYVFYTELFPGVANSTKKLFDKTIPFPIRKFNIFLNKICPYFIDKIISQVAKLIVDCNIKQLIISGGIDVHIQLVEKLHRIKGDNSLKIYLLWHGSPAQWVARTHSNNFYRWLELYKHHKIQGIITLKKGLEEFLKANSINSYLLQNFIPNTKKFSAVKRAKFRVGLWSASTGWIKNLYPQVAALTMFHGKISCYTNFHFNNKRYTPWMKENLDMEIFPELLPHKALLNLMAETDLTLYITNSECSPIIVLESLSLGIPCLVGPTSDIYDDEFLRDMLTVNRVDCPLTIFKAIEKIIPNIEIICSKLPAFVSKYNQNAAALKNSFLTSIKD